MNLEEKRRLYLNPEYKSYLVQYKGNILEELDKIDYAVGFVITEKIAIVASKKEDIKTITKDIPSILLIEIRSRYVLESVLASESSNINFLKELKYLTLTGKDVLVGIIDTGIDYLNKEFCYEDGTTRIASIWDQSIEGPDDNDVFIGKTYNRDKINEAIKVNNNKGDPYSIVPSKDEYGHGTSMAGIVGARGYDKEVVGIATDCEFAIVKLREDLAFIEELKKNNIDKVPVYSHCEVFTAIEYLLKVKAREKKPMIILIGVGTSENSHDGNGILSRHINESSRYNPLAFITGVGNEADSEGHASGSVSNEVERKKVELIVPQNMDNLEILIWARKPNKISINIISPFGQESGVLKPKINEVEGVYFVYEDTNVITEFNIPDAITGHQLIVNKFRSIKAGIWKFELIGENMVDGRFDIWLPSKLILPKGMRFLESTNETTINIPSSAREAISVGCYNLGNNTISDSSARGFGLTGAIKPEIVAPGVDVMATSIGGSKAVVSGSCVAAAIVAGVSAVLFQWAIVNKNDYSINATKLKAYLIFGAKREDEFRYPNKALGYGKLDFKGIFNTIMGQRFGEELENPYNEYNVGNLFIRIPRKFARKVEEDTIS